MPQPQQNWAIHVGNHLIMEQLDYDVEEQTRLANEQISKLNEEQRKAFDEIVDAVMHSIHDLAIQKLGSMGVAMTSEEEREALKLFPSV